MVALRIGKIPAGKQAAHLGRVVVRDSGLEPLPDRQRLAQLTSQPADQRNGGRIRHADNANAAREAAQSRG